MRITKFGHACVRIAGPGGDVVLDPGVFTAPDAVDGVAAVLVTHDHVDHFDLERLRRSGAAIWASSAVAAALAEADPAIGSQVTTVAAGDTFTVAGLQISVHGAEHAAVHRDLPIAVNTGFLISDGTTRVFHPGDAFTEPGVPVDVAMTPISGPWLKFSEAIDFARALGAPRALAIHDHMLSEAGLNLADRVMGGLLGGAGIEFVLLENGADLG